MSARELHLGRGLALPLDYVTKTAAVIAKRRVGKTYTGGVLAEEMCAVGIPWYALDPTEAWWGLRSSADGKKAGLPVIVLGGSHGDVPIGEHDGKAIADLVVDEPSYYVIDLSMIDESHAATVRFVTAFLDRLYRRKAQAKDPLHGFWDEADMFAPQKPGPEQTKMLGAAESIVRRGGIRGLGTTLFTQRAAVLNKNVLTQLDILVMLRTISPQDQAAVDEYVKANATPEQRREVMDSLSSLGLGEAWVYGPGEDPELLQRVQIRERRTFNSSATPKAGERRIEPTKLADVDLEALRTRFAAQVEKAKAEDPKVLQQRVRELERELQKEKDRPQDVAEAPEPQVVWPFSAEEFDKALFDAEAAIAEADGARQVLDGMMEPLREKIIDGGRHATWLLEHLTAWRERRDAQAKSIDELIVIATGNAIAQAPPRSARSSVRTAPTVPRSSGGTGKAPRQPSSDTAPRPAAQTNGSISGLSGPEQRVLNAIAWWNAIGVDIPDKQQVGFIADYKVGKKVGGTYGNILGKLHKGDLIGYPVTGCVALTDTGAAVAQPPEATPDEATLQTMIYRQLAGPERRVLEVLVDAGGQPMSKQDLGAAAGYTVGEKVGGTFGNILGKLRTLGLIDYPSPGQAAASSLMWLTV